MNLDSLIDSLQKGFRISVGAATSFVEVLQDPLKREEYLAQAKQNLSQVPVILQDAQLREAKIRELQVELNQLTELWAARGEVTEREARNLVDALWSRYNSAPPEPHSPSERTIDATATTVASPVAQQEIQELTAQISALREELEQLRQQRGTNA